ncbi:MAG: hypothetical protein EZS28_028544 [Streblomastix strix]|uniref:Uncharacterized protein n=1 Tax=Streblomastix strix TaxID=222440 RepID=A0A5J4UZQ0_9EUKA|nr:MAG: hypothetical protein EZS28_028544 [Streblomastix strix]
MISDRKFRYDEEEEKIIEEEVIEKIEAPPAQPVPVTPSITVVPDHSQRQIGGQTPQLVSSHNSWNSIKSPTPKQQSKQPTLIQRTTPSISTSQSSENTNSIIISIPIPNVDQVQQEQDHLFCPSVAISPPPIVPSNNELPPVADTQLCNITQTINNMLISQQQTQNQQQLVNQKKQLFNLYNQKFTSKLYILPDHPKSWSSIITQPVDIDFSVEQEARRLCNKIILQDNKARKEYRIYMQKRIQNRTQKFLMDGTLKNLEARSKGFDNPSYNPLGNFQHSFNPNQYFNNLSQISSLDQLEFSDDLDYYQIKRDDDHDSNDDLFGEADLIQLKVRGYRGRGKKNRGKYAVQVKVPGQRRKNSGAANGTINPSSQSFLIKQITGGSNFNFGSVGENGNVFAAQRSYNQHQNDENEMNISPLGHLSAQNIDGLGFQPLIGPEQEQSEDRTEQNQGQQDLNNLLDSTENEGPLGLHKKPEGAKRIKAALKHSVDLPVRRR